MVSPRFPAVDNGGPGGIDREDTACPKRSSELALVMKNGTIVCRSSLAVNPDDYLLSPDGKASPGRMRIRGGQEHA
jgi:hypothetical protein